MALKSENLIIEKRPAPPQHQDEMTHVTVTGVIFAYRVGEAYFVVLHPSSPSTIPSVDMRCVAEDRKRGTSHWHALMKYYAHCQWIRLPFHVQYIYIYAYI